MKIDFKKLAEDITKNCETEKEKADALYWFVKEEIKYKITIVGDPEEILELRYGSCIDKSILFKKLAQELGIKTRYHIVLIDLKPILEKTPFGRFLAGIEKLPLLPHVYPEVFLNEGWVKIDGPALDYDLEKSFPGGLLKIAQKDNGKYIKDIGSFDKISQVLNVSYIKELLSLFKERYEDIYDILNKINNYLFKLRNNKLDFLKKEKRTAEEFKEDIEKILNSPL